MSMKDSCTKVFQGVGRALVESSDTVLLKVKNIKGSDGFDFGDIEFHGNPVASKILQKGDIVTAFIGEAMKLHSFSIFEGSKYICTVDNNCGVFRPNVARVIPRFLYHALQTSWVREQLSQLIGGGGVPFLGAANAENLWTVIPEDQDIQRTLVSEMEKSRESRRSKLAEADSLLSGLDTFLLGHLGMTVPESDNRLTYAMRLSAIHESKQIGADYFHPERMNTLRAIQKAKKAKRAVRLDDVTDFLRNIATEYEPEQYLGLAGVQSQTGELAETSEEPGKGQAFRYEESDVLFARLRPYLNKVWRAECGGVCSTEFHVIRVKESVSDLLPDYLAAVLRSSVIVAQTKHMMTGNTHPRLANEDVVDLLIPIPDEKIQQEIVNELRKRRAEARRLREEAVREWDAAKASFEIKLLGTAIQ
jgi:hypothetical protein